MGFGASVPGSPRKEALPSSRQCPAVHWTAGFSLSNPKSATEKERHPKGVSLFLEKLHKADTIHRLLCSIHFGTAASELVCKLNNSACFSKGFTPPSSGVGISEYASRIGERSANTKQNPFVLIALL